MQKYYSNVILFIQGLKINIFQCNEDCGRGLQKREITCVSEMGEASEDCNVWEKPQHVRECMGSCLPKSDEGIVLVVFCG